jgi:hypothetical protein
MSQMRDEWGTRMVWMGLYFWMRETSRTAPREALVVRAA